MKTLLKKCIRPTVEFDDYLDNCDRCARMTKERRCQARRICPDIDFNSKITCTVTQDKFSLISQIKIILFHN